MSRWALGTLRASTANLIALNECYSIREPFALPANRWECFGFHSGRSIWTFVVSIVCTLYVVYFELRSTLWNSVLCFGLRFMFWTSILDANASEPPLLSVSGYRIVAHCGHRPFPGHFQAVIAHKLLLTRFSLFQAQFPALSRPHNISMQFN